MVFGKKKNKSLAKRQKKTRNAWKPANQDSNNEDEEHASNNQPGNEPGASRKSRNQAPQYAPDDDSDVEEIEAAEFYKNTTGTFEEETTQFSCIISPDKVRRLMVAIIFEGEHGATPDKRKWPDIAQSIRQRLGFSARATVTDIFQAVLDCRATMTEYDGERRVAEDRKLGRQPHISPQSAEAQIIADAMESGTGEPLCLWIVNQYRKSIGATALTITPVKTCIQTLNPKYLRIKPRSQGSDDPESPWCKARCNWYTQLLIRLGQLDEGEVELLKDPSTKELPPYFDMNRSSPISIVQLATVPK
jgi:hypothetical protein